jgi:hypothetical protein
MMKSTQVTLKHILAHVLIYAKKDDKDGVITLTRPDFSSEHQIPGVKHNWSPDKIEINVELNTMKVWRIGEQSPSIRVEHLLHDEQGYSTVEGLRQDDLPKAEEKKTEKKPKEKKTTKVEEKTDSTFDE